MKKVGFVAVSLAAIFAVGAARADIASTTYVADAITSKEDIANKATGDNYTSGSTTEYPSIKVAETIAGKAVEGVSKGLGALAGLDTVGTDEIDNKSVTKEKLSDAVQASLGKADSAVQPAAISDMETKTHAAATYATKVEMEGLDDRKQDALTAGANITITKSDGKTTISTHAPVTPGNGTVTIMQGGVNKGDFTLDQAGNKTIELTDNNTTYTASGSNGVSASVEGSVVKVAGTAATRDAVGVAKLGVIPVGTTGTATATIWVE